MTAEDLSLLFSSCVRRWISILVATTPTSQVWMMECCSLLPEMPQRVKPLIYCTIEYQTHIKTIGCLALVLCNSRYETYFSMSGSLLALMASSWSLMKSQKSFSLVLLLRTSGIWRCATQSMCRFTYFIILNRDADPHWFMQNRIQHSF